MAKLTCAKPDCSNPQARDFSLCQKHVDEAIRRWAKRSPKAAAAWRARQRRKAA